MTSELLSLLTGEVLDENLDLSLADLSHTCQVPAERIMRLVDEGIIEPRGRRPEQWRFSGISVRRIRCVQRLERDLGVNLAGAALALDLIEELQQLRARLHRFGD